MFESYAQSWLLNYLLEKLEMGTILTAGEDKLARKFSPGRSHSNLPTFPLIVRLLPFLEAGLSSIPHIATNPLTGQDVTTPVTQRLNALATIQFWRDHRNLVVHGSGMVSSWFYRKHADFVEE